MFYYKCQKKIITPTLFAESKDQKSPFNIVNEISNKKPRYLIIVFNLNV